MALEGGEPTEAYDEKASQIDAGGGSPKTAGTLLQELVQNPSKRGLVLDLKHWSSSLQVTRKKQRVNKLPDVSNIKPVEPFDDSTETKSKKVSTAAPKAMVEPNRLGYGSQPAPSGSDSSSRSSDASEEGGKGKDEGIEVPNPKGTNIPKHVEAELDLFKMGEFCCKVVAKFASGNSNMEKFENNVMQINQRTKMEHCRLHVERAGDRTTVWNFTPI